MYCMLPIVGVAKTFPNTTACQSRLAEVRWPSGVTCTSCGDPNVGKIVSRSLYQCRACRTQFSGTAGTEFHRSRLDLRMWFIAAEDVITAYAKGREYDQLTGNRLTDRYGISYAAAHRLKTTLVRDLRKTGNLLTACICTEELLVTRAPVETPEEWYETLWRVRL